MGSITLPALAAKPVDAGNGKVMLKQEKAQTRTEAREMRAEKREFKNEEQYNKKTALMIRHFDKKLAIFEEHMNDKILLNVYPIFIDKLDRFIEKVKEQDVDEEIKTERLDYLSGLSEVITEELVVLNENVNNNEDAHMNNDETDED